MKTKHFNRRIFLRGLGGAAVAAPFLSSVAEREAKAHIANKSAVECSEDEPDYIPPDGTEAMVMVNKTIREQTTTVQPKRKTA